MARFAAGKAVFLIGQWKSRMGSIATVLRKARVLDYTKYLTRVNGVVS